ncbi:MAG: transglutaminase-like domain-containing protein [Firmicutes bacterium]|jgi:hypothetical protein|nr:transglutaminase-like domain-containing protein [Bacillota bacterium]
MKKILSFAIVLMLIVSSSSQSFASTQMIQANSEIGIVKVQLEDTESAKMVLLVEKDDVRYTYPIVDTDINQFPLQLGNGEYTVRVMQNTVGNSYKELSRINVSLDLENSNSVFLASIQDIEFDKSSLPIIKAKALTKGLTKDEDKVKAIYNYVNQNVKYDYSKAKTVKSGYFPNIDSTYKTNTGICYDYASIVAAMLRSVGIPTKLIKGYSIPTKDVYHAWNEVYIDGEWKIIDTTVDSAYVQANMSTKMFKSFSDYKASKVY